MPYCVTDLCNIDRIHRQFCTFFKFGSSILTRIIEILKMTSAMLWKDVSDSMSCTVFRFNAASPLNASTVLIRDRYGIDRLVSW